MLGAVPALDRLTQALIDGRSVVVIEPPGAGHGYWAGGPSVVADQDGYHLAYRLRRPVAEGRGYANVVAHSTDGVHFRTVAVVEVSRFGAASLERPALIRRPDGGWRLYVSCSTPGSKHWWVEAVDSPGSDAAGLETGRRTVVLPGDDVSAWKDVVVARDGDAWQMWACRHLLDRGDAEADRMETWFAVSDDGLAWNMKGPALTPTAGTWDRRGTRVTSVLETDAGWLASYDGRATADENWYEKTGFAFGPAPDQLTAVAGPVDRRGATLRYVTVVPVDGGLRVYFECARPDGANELRTALVPGADALTTTAGR